MNGTQNGVSTAVVAKVVESEPSELLAPAGFSLLSRPLDGLSEDVGPEVVRVPDSIRAGRREDETCRCRAACQQLLADRLHGRRAEVHASLLPRRRSALELGIDFVARQVARVARGARRAPAGDGWTTIPVLVFDDGSALVGEERIGAYLDAVHEPPEGRYRLKAAKARRRYLEEECQC